MSIFDLGPLSKLFIRICCWRDRRNRMNHRRGPKTNAEESSLSPFVATELAYYSARREKLLNNAIVSVNYSGRNNIFGVQFHRYKKSLCRLDERIESSNRDINSALYSYSCRIQELRDRKRLLENPADPDNQAPHNAQYCQQQIDELKKDLQIRLPKLQQKRFSLASEKVRLLNTVNSRINACKNRMLLRIMYYYALLEPYASGKLALSLCLKDETIEISEESLGREHTGKLKDAENDILGLKTQERQENEIVKTGSIPECSQTEQQDINSAADKNADHDQDTKHEVTDDVEVVDEV